MVASVGRKKKDADRVNYNISRNIRAAVISEAEKINWTEIDMIEELIRAGLVAKELLKKGELDYVVYSQTLEEIFFDGSDEAE